MFILYSGIIISLLYILLITYVYSGWQKQKTDEQEISNGQASLISVIIPFKNESKNLPNILKTIQNQSLNKNKFEVILVNDNSTDNSSQIAKNYVRKFKNFKLINLEDGTGKKAALQKGIESALGEIIVTTDADCYLPQKWLQTISNYFIDETTSMLIMPVIYKNSGRLITFENLQALEFLSLMATTCGFALHKNPIMCNGANLAYRKKILNQFTNPLLSDIASGDDTFLMFRQKKIDKNAIKCLLNKDVTVETTASKKLKDFVNQRIRWASKTKFYNDISVIITGIITFLENMLLFILFWLSIFQILPFKYFLIFYTVKTVIEFPLMLKTSKFFEQSKLMWLFIPLQFLYFNYVFLIGLLAQFVPYKWKGEKINPNYNNSN